MIASPSMSHARLRRQRYWPLVAVLLLVLLSIGITSAAPASNAGAGTSANSSVLIRLQYATFDPLRGEPAIPANLRASANQTNPIQHYLVQFSGVVQQQWKDSVVAAGGTIHDYIPDNAFIIGLSPAAKQAVSSLSFVRWVGAFQPAYKLSSEVAKFVNQAQSARLTLDLTVFRDGDPATVAALPAIKVLSQSANSFDTVMRVQLDSSQLVSLAQLDAVSRIEIFHQPVALNDQMRQIDGVNTIWSAGLQLFGQGQIVAVADTGLDTGSTSTLSPDFAGRLTAADALGRSGDWSDICGHGTHVAGTVLGNGVRSGSNPATHSYISSFAGLAPEAHLVFQSIADSNCQLSGIPADLNTLFGQAYSQGARIHSNSWGAALNGEYDTMAQEVDQFIWAHPDMSILFAAGNSGVDNDSNGVVDLGSLGSPASAKNGITVGASENNRPPNGGSCGASGTGYANCTYGVFNGFPADPLNSDYVSNNPNGMAAFSSRGPALDGRIKPDITNVGTSVLSVHSQDPSADSGWGLYNQYYMFDGGTSMATPGTAGAAALVRQFLAGQGVSDPSAALIKALMMNAAAEMAPGQYGTGATQEMGARPNNVEGWGRVNLLNSLYPAAPMQSSYRDDLSISTGNNTPYVYSVGTNGQPLHVTLSWSDYPGSPDAAVELVNDLDLAVVGPDGTHYWGNGVTNGDRLNNVETVDLPSAAAGTYTIHVLGHNVPQGPQHAALTVYGALGTAAPTPTPQATVCANPFSDINGNVFFVAINTLYCHGVINGTDSSHFSPAGTATRGQFAKVVVLGFGTPFYTPATPDFTDVPTSYFAYTFIESGFHAGILSGYDANTCHLHNLSAPCYLPNVPITRGQITKLVVNAAHYTLVTPGGQTFSDVPPSNVFYLAIETAHAKGVINGYPNGTFQPNNNVRRDAMAQIVYKGTITP